MAGSVLAAHSLAHNGDLGAEAVITRLVVGRPLHPALWEWVHRRGSLPTEFTHRGLTPTMGTLHPLALICTR